MNIELINKQTAVKKWQSVKEAAYAFSFSYEKPIAEINEQACIDFINYAALTQLQEDEVCVFVNGSPAKWQTGHLTEGGGMVIGKLCFKSVKDAYIQGGKLCIEFKDGLIEQYRQKNELWYPVNSEILSN